MAGHAHKLAEKLLILKHCDDFLTQIKRLHDCPESVQIVFVSNKQRIRLYPFEVVRESLKTASTRFINWRVNGIHKR